MTRGRRIAVSLLYSAAFLAGLAAVWVGLEALTFGGLGARRALLSLAPGFTIWIVLAAVTAAAGDRRRDAPGRP